MSNKELEQRCTTLRHDLKAWEKNFASQHNGQRAGRDDIKADSVISQKYKEYNKLREILSGKIAPQTPSKRTASRKTSHHIECTPKANSRQAVATPLKRKREEELAVESVDSGAEFLSPQGPSVIGPTPQRDGIVLGLFDLLPQGTPSKQRKALGDVSLNVLQTPSKKPEKAESEASSLEPHARGERTPLSSGKRFMLDTFVTPKKRKLEEEGTPTSTAKAFATPAFLRRNNALGAIDETDEPIPRPAPWKRGSLVRSLSSMIRSMQKQEDDRLDEEADIMREIELEEQGISLPKKPRIPEIQVEDSQAAMPLGPDRDLSDEDNESEANEELGPDGKPLRVWKKKGPKRQTRRVIMRPNFAKPKPPPTLARDEESEDEQSKTQDKRAPEENALSGDGFSESDFDGSDYASDDSHTPKKRKTQHKTQDTSTPQPKQGKTTKMEAVKTAARKIKATAHANYRRLNIKSKAGNGGKGRFGRRR